MKSPSMTVAQFAARQLVAQGVPRAFCVPGESYLALIDELLDVRDRLELVTCRHEAAATSAAAAHARLTDGLGVALVSRGPGAMHASIGIHTARQDSLPLVMLVGQVPRAHRGREAFQEIDVGAAFASLAKWAGTACSARSFPGLFQHAIGVATAGRPGPVVLAVPEDLWSDRVEDDPIVVDPPLTTVAHEAALDDALRTLAEAEAPLAIVGGSVWTASGRAALHSLAERHALPVATAFRRKDLFDNTHPCYAGELGFAINPRLAARVRGADVILALGTRLGDITTGHYQLLEAPAPRQKLIHAHVDAEELGRVYRPCVALPGDPGHTVERLLERLSPAKRWETCRREARADYESFLVPPTTAHALDLGRVFRALDALAPEDAVFTNGAGNYALFLHRFVQHRHRGTQIAPTSGAMGFGLPAAIAAKLQWHDRTVICVSGDGCLQMALQELATACHYGLGIKLLLVNNQSYGTIRMYQERRFPGRAHGTDIPAPDFVAIARGFGWLAERVTTTAEALDALPGWIHGAEPALLELSIGIGQIAPGVDLSIGTKGGDR